MTRITWDAAENRMEFKGHAGGGEAGKDLICAAVSTLMYTLIEAVGNHFEALMPNIYMADGEASVSCSPGKGHKAVCWTIMETVFTGCELLAKEYPEHVQAIKLQEG